MVVGFDLIVNTDQTSTVFGRVRHQFADDQTYGLNRRRRDIALIAANLNFSTEDRFKIDA